MEEFFDQLNEYNIDAFKLLKELCLLTITIEVFLL